MPVTGITDKSIKPYFLSRPSVIYTYRFSRDALQSH